ncbi:MAG: ATP-grasp domain-containing protein [Gammaproteobacteria bacterium]|nr:ATP-grasp domain-containing protein [Gammaproteobacteria bacterium]
MADVKIKPIQRILVANRGEIARRVFRTASDMGIATVAVYADGDADAPFVRDADVAIALNGTTSAQTYLDIAKVLEACKASGADAVHPGYGFLSENAQFAEAVQAMGVTWIGPPVEAIKQMGDKLAAKALMTAANVPTLPATEVTGDTDLEAAAKEIGYPVLVKASAGGGGRGMRIVDSPDGLADAVSGARREAGASFGDDTIFFERWLTSSRHVEMQIMGDLHGEAVHMFERECSIQRRHQKIIEEAPSSAISQDLRNRMGEAALAAARQLGYASAGTVEFLVSGDEFWFLEVNTRLQVEHPVTEEITGIDLVREQIRIAEGEPLGYTQEDLSINGHSIEARVYAENPANNFLPSPGTIDVWEPSSRVRVDSGVESGSEVSVYFDPLIAKVISHAPTRREAAAKLARGLETTQLHGISNNRDFLVATLRTPEFLNGDTTTDFIERVNPPRTRQPSKAELINTTIAASLFAQQQRRESARVLTYIQSGWRNSLMPPERVSFQYDDNRIDLEYRAKREGSFVFMHGDDNYVVVVRQVAADSIDIVINDQRMKFHIRGNGSMWQTHGPAGDIQIEELPRFVIPDEAELAGGLIAPMPGKVLATEVSEGDQVEAGDLLVILEAMKMEHRIVAPAAGTITKVHIEVGEQVEKDVVLVDLQEAET